MARTLSQAWPTSSWSTNSVVWRLGALTETLMRERPTRWASGRHGSKPAREMIRPTLWSLRISGNVSTVSLAETATFPLMAFKYLTVFADFKYARSYFDASLAAVPFTPDPFKSPGTNAFFSPNGISVPIQNAFNPFTVGDTTLVVNGVPVAMTTGVRFRGINDTGPRSEKFTYNDSLFDVGLRGQMGEFGDYFKTWNWETGFRYSRNEGTDISVGEVSQPGLRDALLDTDPATAFNAFGGID